MAIVRFSTKQFEDALPVGAAFQSIQNGERVYSLPINPHVHIFIRSSIGPNGFANDTGEDSIRMWIEVLREDGTRQSLAKNEDLSRYTTRVSGWEMRMNDKLEELVKVASRIQKSISVCPDCGKPKWLNITKKEGPNKGRPFASCANRGHNTFEWMDAPNKKSEPVVSKNAFEGKEKTSARDLFGGPELSISFEEEKEEEAPKVREPNEQQLAIIEAPIDKAIRVLAGPGSGKTFCSERRIVHFVKVHGAQAGQILYCTFTKTMADEGAGRIGKALKHELSMSEFEIAEYQKWFCTIHAACFRMLRAEGMRADVAKNWQLKKVLEPLIEEYWKDCEMDDEKRPSVEEVYKAICNAKMYAQRPGHDKSFFCEFFGDYHGVRLNPVRNKFDEQLKRESLITFPDMLYLIEQKLLDDERFLRKWQNQFKYIIVDECLLYSTPILMADGTTRKIGELVEQKVQAEVLTYNRETGQQEPKLITNWQKLPGKTLYKIKAARPRQVNLDAKYSQQLLNYEVLNKLHNNFHLHYTTIADLLGFTTDTISKKLNVLGICKSKKEQYARQTGQRIENAKQWLKEATPTRLYGEPFFELVLTYNHKVYVKDKGFIETEILYPGDVIQGESSMIGRMTKWCPTCKDMVHPAHHHEPRGTHPCPLCNKGNFLPYQLRDHLQKHIDPDHKRVYNLTEDGLRALQRFGQDNVMKRPEVRKRTGEGVRRWWNNLTEEERARRIQTFINAPEYNHLPNRKEQSIIDMGLPIKYVGDGSMFVTFQNGRRKNPDFVVRGNRKVIEVADFEYWHTPEEMEEVRQQYEAIGIECLVVDAININREDIEQFINNDCPMDLVVIEITKLEEEVEWVYDITVTDNHNFYANGLLVHNCQDTNGQAMRILTKLVENSHFMAVGDVDQMLMRFTGATPEENLYSGFERQFPDGRLFMLETNYRCTSHLVQMANNLIRFNYADDNGPYEQMYKKNLRPRYNADEGVKISFQNYEDPVEEAAALVQNIQEQLAHGRKPGDMFVGARTRAQLGYLEGPLTVAGIPFINIKGGSFWLQKHVNDVVSYLRLVHDPENKDAFKRVFNIASKDFTAPWGEHKGQYVNQRWLGAAFLEACSGKMTNMRYASRQRRAWEPGVRDIEMLMSELNAHLRDGPKAILQAVIDNCYQVYLEYEEGNAELDEADGGKLNDLMTVCDLASRFGTIPEFLKHVDNAIEAAQKAKDRDWDEYVVLSTIHGLKGLERPIVFGVGISEGEVISKDGTSTPYGLLPHTFSLTDPPNFGAFNFGGRGSVADERCCAFVLVTRAKEEVILSGVLRYRKAEMWPSRFLYEMGILQRDATQGNGQYEAFRDFEEVELIESYQE